MSEQPSVPSDSAMGVILPEAHGALGEFWRGVADGKLLLQRCRGCGNVWHPPSDLCVKCQSLDIEWMPARGTGTLYSFTVVRHAVHPVVAQWIPYTLAVVTLDEGTRFLSLLGESEVAPTIGRAVQLRFRQMPEGFQLPIFEMVQVNT